MCVTGYSASNNGTCVSCDYPCLTCNSDGSCKTCETPFYVSTPDSNNKCYESTIAQCATYNSTDSNNCLTCITGYTLASNVCSRICAVTCMTCGSND